MLSVTKQPTKITKKKESNGDLCMRLDSLSVNYILLSRLES